MKTKLFPYQTDAVSAISQELGSSARTTVVMPCGTGKTLVAAATSHALAPVTVVIFLPSLALLRQTLQTWKKEMPLGEHWTFQCVCSDATVHQDEPVVTESDLGAKITTNSTEVARFLSNPDVPKVIFSTYHSAHVVARGMPRGFRFDLGLMDEAHRTAGEDEAAFSFVLQDKNIKIVKRIFFTATPKHSAIEEGEKAFSMDDPNVYGKVSYALSFREAIERGLIADYRIILSVVTSSDVDAQMVQMGMVRDDRNKAYARHVAGAIAIKNAMDKFGIRKTFTFHRTIADAQTFVENPFVRQEIPADLYHVSGKTPMVVRDEILGEFASSQAGLVSNARCLTEGVDIPSVDMVAFMSPRKSTIDIVQATGRAMRLYSGKTFGYVLLPVYLDEAEGEDVLSAVKRADFHAAWEVISTLKEQETVVARRKKGRRDADPRAKISDVDMASVVDYVGPAVMLDSLRRAISVQILNGLKTSSDIRLEELVAFRSAYGHLLLPRTEQYAPLATWIRGQRNLRKRGLLSQERIDALEAIDFPWTEKDAKWEEGFCRFLAHKQATQKVPVPGARNARHFPADMLDWCKEQWTAKKKGEMTEDRQKKLKKAGFLLEAPGPVENYGHQDDVMEFAVERRRSYRDAAGNVSREATERELLARSYWNGMLWRFCHRFDLLRTRDEFNAWITEQYEAYAAGALENWKMDKLKGAEFRFDLPLQSLLLDERGSHDFLKALLNRKKTTGSWLVPADHADHQLYQYSRFLLSEYPGSRAMRQLDKLNGTS